KRVEEAGDGVDEGGVVVFPAGLVFFGSVVVVDGEHQPTFRPRGGAQQDRRFPTVGTDFGDHPTAAVLHRRRVQGPTLVLRHESGGAAGMVEQLLVGQRRGGGWSSHRRCVLSSVGTSGTVPTDTTRSRRTSGRLLRHCVHTTI